MEDCVNKRLSIENKLICENSKVNHHTSVQYRASFYSKNPIFRRGSNSQILQLQKIKREEIFQMVYRFIGKIVTNSQYLQEILQTMNYDKEDKTISVTKINKIDSEKQNSDPSVESDEIVLQSLESDQNINIEPLKKIQQKISLKKKQIREPKISIVLGSFSDFSVGSGSKISCNSFINISSINFPPHVLTVEMINKIFDEPEPFLINLAMCLMLKFLFYSKMKLTCANSCWILSIATIIGYKIYYDEPVGGLVDSFADILEISSEDIMNLQRYFLDQISFQAIVTSQQYHKMLSKIITA